MFWTVTASGPSPIGRLFSLSQVLKAMSWVLPSCGVAMIVPLSCSGEVMSGLVTSWAPAEVEPATRRTASPFDLVKALIAGPEPMNATSIEPPSRALTWSGPALKVWVVSFVLPSSLANRPCFTPTSAGAWVMFGK